MKCTKCGHDLDLEAQYRAFLKVALPPLTRKLRIVLWFMLTGRRMTWIAKVCRITIKTMKSEARAIYRRYDVTNRAELMALFSGFDDLPMPIVRPDARSRLARQERARQGVVPVGQLDAERPAKLG